MELKLGHVLAGLAVRAGKPKRQRLVDDFAVGRIAHPRERRLARRRHAADQLFERRRRASRPQTRTTAIAAGGRPDESAKMVGRSLVTVIGNASSRQLRWRRQSVIRQLP